MKRGKKIKQEGRRERQIERREVVWSVNADEVRRKYGGKIFVRV